MNLKLVGAYPSPYTRKMRAVLRYRRIPFRWVLRNSEWDDLPAVTVPVIPVLVFPDGDGNHGEAMVDSSPQIARLEQEYSGRSLVPRDWRLDRNRCGDVDLVVGGAHASPRAARPHNRCCPSRRCVRRSCPRRGEFLMTPARATTMRGGVRPAERPARMFAMVWSR